MSGFFSDSSSRRRYPDPNMGGKHYRKKGLFGMFSGFGSFSGSGSSGRYGGCVRTDNLSEMRHLRSGGFQVLPGMW